MLKEINFGNFCKRSETSSTKFNFYKPIISLFTNCIFIFAFIGLMVSASSYLYAEYNVPVQDYDVSTYQKAHILTDKIHQSLQMLKEARPEDINICQIMQNLLNAKPNSVTVSDIHISPSKYQIRGNAYKMDDPLSFVNKMDFGNNKIADLSDVKNKDDVIYWTINVTVKEGEKK